MNGGRVASTALAAVLILAASGTAATAQETRYYTEGRFLVREISGAVPQALSRVRVETDLGGVQARAATAAEVGYRIRVRARGADDARTRERLEALIISAETAGDLLVFRGEAPGGTLPAGLQADFDLDLPGSVTEFAVITGAGPVGAQGLGARTTLQTRAGNISADRLRGPLTAETRGGNVEVGEVEQAARLVSAGGLVRVTRAGGELVAQTSGGNVTIGRVAGLVRAETGGGNIAIETAQGDVFAQTGGGSIRVGRVAGQLTAASAGGGIQVAGAGAGVRAETAGGSILLEGIAGPIRALTSAGNIRATLLPTARAFFDSDLQTWQGDVVVALPGTLPLSIRAAVEGAAAGGRITSEFPVRIFRDAEDAGHAVQMAEGEIAGGGPVLRIRTLGGTITILKTGDTPSSSGSKGGR